MDWFPPPPNALLTVEPTISTVVVTVDCSLLPVDIVVAPLKMIEGEIIPTGVLRAVIFRDSGSASLPSSSNPGSYFAPPIAASDEEA